MITIYILSLGLGAFGAVVIRRYGEWAGLMDLPGGRSSHSTPTPKGGGIGILASFVLVSLVIGMPNVFWLAGGVVSLVGLYGDRIHLSPKFRLIVQFGVAVILLTGMTFCQGNPWVRLVLLFPTAVFIVGTANFYNFMDGINGLAALTGVLAFGLLACHLLLNGSDGALTPFAVSISLACLGFLPFNMPKARVFLGDAGSVFLGFIFGVLVVLLSRSLLDVICYAALLFPFYIDELTTMVVRIRRGEPLSRAHRRHLYQLLVNEKGIAHWKITLGYGMLQLVVAVSVLLLKPVGMLPVLLFLGLASLVFIYVSFRVRVQVGEGVGELRGVE